MRFLAFDLGEKRTGIAVGDDVTSIVTPVDVVHHDSNATSIEPLMQVIKKHKPDTIVIGLPLNMDGTEGPAAMRVREIGKKLHHATSLSVQYQDERLTSYAADQNMARTGRTHKAKKELRDALAAVAILQDFFDVQSRESN